jgi:DNA-binding CsgD family transcriptional regulator
MTQLPEYNTHPIRCGNTRCVWTGFETQLARKPMIYTGGIKAERGICPRCSCESYVFLSERKAKAWREQQAKCAYGLSEVQLAVIRTLADGRGQKSAADKLCLSKAIVQDHIKSIYTKLGCHSVERAILLAERAGLLKGVS